MHNNSYIYTIGHRLRDARLGLRLSFRDAASRAGMSPAFLSDIEQGKREQVAFTTLCRYGQALGLNSAKLFEGLF